MAFNVMELADSAATENFIRKPGMSYSGRYRKYIYPASAGLSVSGNVVFWLNPEAPGGISG